MPKDTGDQRAAADDTLELAGRLLGGQLTAVEFLGGSARSIVCRARASNASVVPAGTSVVVKRFVEDPVPPQFNRELAGLQHLERTPTLLASEPEHGLLVIHDLGDWPTLADLLLGEDPQAASAGAREWAGELGELVGASAESAMDVAARLRDQGAADNHDMAGMVTDGLHRLLVLGGDTDRGDLDASFSSTAAKALPPELSEELARVRSLLGPTPGAVIWPGDTCPDNAMRTPVGWRFFDLEWTAVDHPAMVAAYTVLPFATCWCVFDPPAGLTDELFTAFTGGLRTHLGSVTSGAEWPRQVQLAATAWILTVGTILLEPSLKENRRIGPGDVAAPTARQLLATRWRWGARELVDTVPAIAALCARAADWAGRTWGSDAAPIGPYRAFT